MFIFEFIIAYSSFGFSLSLCLLSCVLFVQLREEVSSAKGLHSSVGKDVADAQMKVSKISYALFQVQPEKEIAVEEEVFYDVLCVIL